MSRKLIELASVPQQVPQNHPFDEVKFSETLRALKTPFKENMLEIGTETKFVRFDYEKWNSIKMGFEQVACDLPFSKLILAYIQGYVILGAAPTPASGVAYRTLATKPNQPVMPAVPLNGANKATLARFAADYETYRGELKDYEGELKTWEALPEPPVVSNTQQVVYCDESKAAEKGFAQMLEKVGVKLAIMLSLALGPRLKAVASIRKILDGPRVQLQIPRLFLALEEMIEGKTGQAAVDAGVRFQRHIWTQGEDGFETFLQKLRDLTLQWRNQGGQCPDEVVDAKITQGMSESGSEKVLLMYDQMRQSLIFSGQQAKHGLDLIDALLAMKEESRTSRGIWNNKETKRPNDISGLNALRENANKQKEKNQGEDTQSKKECWFGSNCKRPECKFKHPENHGTSSNNKSNQPMTDQSKQQCDFCLQPGHTRSKCIREFKGMTQEAAREATKRSMESKASNKQKKSKSKVNAAVSTSGQNSRETSDNDSDSESMEDPELQKVIAAAIKQYKASGKKESLNIVKNQSAPKSSGTGFFRLGAMRVVPTPSPYRPKIKIEGKTLQRMRLAALASKKDGHIYRFADSGAVVTIVPSSSYCIKVWEEQTTLELPERSNHSCSHRGIIRQRAFANGKETGFIDQEAVIWPQATAIIFSEISMVGNGSAQPILDPTKREFLQISRSVEKFELTSSTTRETLLQGFFDPDTKLHRLASSVEEHLEHRATASFLVPQILRAMQTQKPIIFEIFKKMNEEELKIEKEKRAILQLKPAPLEESVVQSFMADSRFELTIMEAYHHDVNFLLENIDTRLIEGSITAEIYTRIAKRLRIIDPEISLEEIIQKAKSHNEGAEPIAEAQPESQDQTLNLGAIVASQLQDEVIDDREVKPNPQDICFLRPTDFGRQQRDLNADSLATKVETGRDERCTPNSIPGYFRGTFAEPHQTLSKSDLDAVDQNIEPVSISMVKKATGVSGEIMRTHNSCGHIPFQECCEIKKIPFRADYEFMCRPCAAGGLKAARKQVKPETRMIQKPTKATERGQHFYVDLHGKVRVQTANGKRYAMVLVCGFTDRAFSLLLRKKKDAYQNFKLFVVWVQAQTRNPVQKVSSDNDGIFRAQVFLEILELQGIQSDRRAPHASWTNPYAERKIGVIKVKVRITMFKAGAPSALWGECWLYITFVINIVGTEGTPEGFNCPMSAWLGQNIQDRHQILYPWGCEFWIFNHASNPKNASRDLLTEQGLPAIFIGEEGDGKMVRALSIKHGRVLRTVNFIAFPDSFPMTEQRKYGLDLNEIFRSNAWWSNLFEESESNFERGVVDSWTLPDAEFEYDYRNAVRHASKFVQGPTQSELDHKHVDEDEPQKQVAQNPNELQPRPQRSRELSQKALENAAQKFTTDLQQFQPVPANAIQKLEAKLAEEDMRGNQTILKQECVASDAIRAILATISNDNGGCTDYEFFKSVLDIEASKHPMFLMAIHTAMNLPPATRRIMLKLPPEERELYIQAEKDHLADLEQLDYAELVPRPPNRTIIPVKFVYTKKRAAAKEAEGPGEVARPNSTTNRRDINLTPDEYKISARLVMLGFMQRKGVDFKETWSPTVPWKLIRIILALWTIFDWDLAEKKDLKQAFNSTDMEEEIFIEQPPGYAMKGKESWALRLKKSLPGGKQCGRNLHISLRALFLTKAGWKAITVDLGIYIWSDSENPSVFLILIIWVDDLFFFGSKMAAIKQIERTVAVLMEAKYKIHHLGDITQTDLLRLQIRRDRTKGETTISAKPYVMEILKKFKNKRGISYYDAGETKAVPIKSGILLKPAPESHQATEEEISLYLQICMCLMYLMLLVRPDLAYPVGLAARFVKNPFSTHFDLLDGILKYLTGTQDLLLTYAKNSEQSPFLRMTYDGEKPDPNNLRQLNDSSWLDDLIRRHTTMGRCTFLGACLVDWRSLLIKRIMLSSNHAEFYSSNEGAKDIVHLQNFLHEIGFGHLAICVPMLGDNQGALSLAQGTVSATQNRAYDLLLFYQRELADQQKIKFIYINTSDNVADLMTKALPEETFLKHVKNLGMRIRVYAIAERVTTVKSKKRHI